MSNKKYSISNGNKFGAWLVIDAYIKGDRALCRCDCGKEKLMRASDLVTGRSKSCGKRTCGGSFKDLISMRFGFLTVIEKTTERYPNGSLIWKCICICDKICFVSSKHLLSGATKSCGCQKPRLASIAHSLISEKERAINRLLDGYKRGAKRRNLPFDLTYNQFVDLIKSDCFYCGSLPTRSVVIKKIENTTIHYFSGIDRYDNSLGYLMTNCVPCCQACNGAKMDMAPKEFYEWINRISNFRGGK